MNFKEAWDFLNEHQIFKDEHFISRFQEGLYVEVVYVNPKTNEIDQNEGKNTKINVWLEHGPYEKEHQQCSHDIDLDVGGNSYEEAVVEMARRVEEKYGSAIEWEEKRFQERVEQIRSKGEQEILVSENFAISDGNLLEGYREIRPVIPRQLYRKLLSEAMRRGIHYTDLVEKILEDAIDSQE